MTRRTLVIDANVAIKWLIPEEDSEVAENLLGAFHLIAPQLIFAECANILWKKVRRGELSPESATRAAMFVDEFAVDTVSMRELVPLAVDLSMRLDHAAYDCFYLALAILQDCTFVTADAGFLRKTTERLEQAEASHCLALRAFAPKS